MIENNIKNQSLLSAYYVSGDKFLRCIYVISSSKLYENFSSFIDKENKVQRDR